MYFNGKLTSWQGAAAAAVEGLYGLGWLLVRLLESVCLLTAFTSGTPAAYGMAVGVTAVSTVVLAPWRLGRWLWHLRLRESGGIPRFSLLWTGFRYFSAAVGWRFGVWWRQTTRWLLCLLPATFLWGYGDALSLRGDAAYSLFWMVLGCVALAGGVFWAWLGHGRYGLVPLLLARGYTAALAIPLSVRLTRHHRRAWVDFWGSHIGLLCLCLMPGASLWAVGRLHQSYLTLLEGWLSATLLPATPRPLSAY